MGLDIKAADSIVLKPTITVFGVGGAGGNAINNMIKSGLKGANFVVANTDAQALKHSDSAIKIQLGAESTKGLGAGASPALGHDAAIESEMEIKAVLENSNMLFITAGMGGGTGTGASPVIAKIAKELNILTVGVVTKPFLFEGAKRMKVAEKGLLELQSHVDTLIVVPNQNLFRIANENTTFQEAFEMADHVLHAGVRGVTDLITSPGLVNLDFADIQTIMIEKGKAMMGTGEASGEDRAIKAAESAIANPLLDQNSMHGASGVLINITGGKDMTLYEVDSAANRIREEVGDTDANIIFGSTFNPDLEGVIRVSVVATGIDHLDELEEAKNESVTESKSESLSSKHSTISSNIEETIIKEEVEFQNQAKFDADNDVPPEFEEYTPSIVEQSADMEVADIQMTLQKLSTNQQNDNIESQSHRKESRESHEHGVSRAPQKATVKRSLLKRMWHSIITPDPYHNNDKDMQLDSSNRMKRRESDQEYLSDIQDKPKFFNKKD